jgi:predicted trehalose synthase
MSNVVQLLSGWDPRQEALAEARAYPPGHLDALLGEEGENLPAMDRVTAIVNELEAARQAVWIRRDAEARAEQAITWAVRLEQQLGEIEDLAHKWAAMKAGVMRGAGNTLLDVINGVRGDMPAA